MGGETILTRTIKNGGKARAQLKLVFQRTKFYFLTMVIMLLLAGGFYLFMQKVLLETYQELGTAQAERYAAQIQGDLNLFRGWVNYGAESIDEKAAQGQSAQEITQWIETFYHRIQLVLGEKVVDPYVVLEGTILAASPWEGDDTYDHASTKWYQKAMEAGGEAVFTDVYIDAIHNRSVLTVAQRCRNIDAVIAFDIFPENIALYAHEQGLPAGSSSYVCDSVGTLIYADTKLECPMEQLFAYVGQIHEGIQDGSLSRYSAYIIDPNEERRGVYSASIPEVGWNIYITVPYGAMLSQLNRISAFFAVLVLACFGILLTVTWHNFRLDAGIARARETVQVLGNRYYALYRINYRKDTYEMIKASEHIQKRLPQEGSYPELLRVAGEVVEPEAFQEFCESLSSESISKLVSNGVRDFGGDFLRRFGEEYRWVSVRVLYDQTLDTDEVVLSFQEVDAEKHRQIQERKLLQEALENSKRSEKTKHAFFSNMSHDMRTPLNAIVSLSDLTREYRSDPDKVESYANKISYSSRQLLNLVNDILDMSRMEMGKVVLNNQEIDLQSCVEECCVPFQLQAEAEKKSFTLECHVRSRCVLGDPARIDQILNNLLSNAFKFTAEGDSIRVCMKQIDAVGRTQYQFVVEDTGMGMSQEYLPQLFDPYSRETRFSGRTTVGTGLGMPIVKNLVTEMSGQISVSSELGRGTTFTITIPFPVIQDQGLPVQNVRAEPRTVRKRFSLAGKRILLAEDNLLNMEIATEILSMNGLQILQAWNGVEAVEQFEASPLFSIDAILMDMQMPQMDGCEAARKIRSLLRPDAKTVPILAVTANAFAEDIAATTAAGMNAHISKPIDFEVLCQTMERLIQTDSQEGT